LRIVEQNSEGIEFRFSINNQQLLGELFWCRLRNYYGERTMKPYFSNLASRNWLLLAMVAVVAAYPLFYVVLPAAVHALVPEVVRNVLRVI
jgi:hypothetical protein